MKKSFQIIGHRGGGAGPDENTLASFQQAVRDGADVVEIDVRIKADGTLVTGHNPDDYAEDFTDVLKSLDIPLALHVKEAPWRFRHRFRFDANYYQRIINGLAPLVKGRDITILSFAPGAIRFTRERHPRFKTALASLCPVIDIRRAKRMNADAVGAYPWTIDGVAGRLARKHDISLFPIVKTYSDRRLHRFRKIGVSGVITDDVSGWRRAISAARRG